MPPYFFGRICFIQLPLNNLKYKVLMQSEYFFINANRDKIEKTAVRLHKMRTTYNPDLNKNKLMEITLDFITLEKMCDVYKKK